MIRSLRGRLQLWHAAILAIAVTVFAGAFYHLLRRSTLDEIDLELLSGARQLEGALRVAPPLATDAMLAELPLELSPRPHRSRPGGPPPRDAGERAPFPPDRAPFPPVTRQYFAIFSAGGKLLRAESDDVPVTWVATRRPLEYRSLQGRREALLRGPHNTLIVVGRDVRPQMRRLTESLVHLILIGAGVLALGLVGGWWLAEKAIQPIDRIRETAGKISAANLSERVDTARMDRELQSLASIFNSMLDRLDDSFQQQSQFVADASHELRTPVAVVLSHCELALNRPRTADEYQKTLATCQKASERMKGLVDGLLTLARADAGRLELRPASVDLRVLAAEAAEMFAPLAAERRVTISVTGDEAICVADAASVSRVIANLLHNAILYNRPGGLARLETGAADGEAFLRVRDNGPGIAPEPLKHVFDRFYRVEEARSRPAGGSGLGLSICKGIVEAHGGRVSVESQLGEGSVFEIRLPIESTAPPPGE